MADTTTPVNQPDSSPTQNQTKKESFFKRIWNDKKKRWWLIGGGVVLLSAIFVVVMAATKPTPETIALPVAITPTPIVTTTPANEYSMLDGTLVGAERANRHPLGIMVENLSTIRPQTGISDASIVYESIVEGGITRYMAVYAPTLPAKVGPVRSARTQFLDWAQEYTPQSAYYAHAGGAVDALSKIVGDTINDLDYTAAGKAYQRFPKAGLASEHTLYTFPDKLYEAARDKKYSTDSTFQVWKFKEDADSANRPEAQSITIPYSSAGYTVKFTYDKASNSYKRSISGKDDIDAGNNKQIAVKNLVVHFATYQDTGKKGIQRVGLIGEGTAKIFFDGKLIEAKWKKLKPKERTIYTDTATGAEIQFNRGQFWVAAPKTGTSITVQ